MELKSATELAKSVSLGKLTGTLQAFKAGAENAGQPVSSGARAYFTKAIATLEEAVALKKAAADKRAAARKAKTAALPA